MTPSEAGVEITVFRRFLFRQQTAVPPLALLLLLIERQPWLSLSQAAILAMSQKGTSCPIPCVPITLSLALHKGANS